VNTSTVSKKDKIRKFFKKAFNRDLSDAEILEIHQSLLYFAQAKTRYLKLKKGKNGSK
jgi:hypothetical protein